MDSFHSLQPTDPPLLPISDQPPPAALDLEASRSHSRTHSEASETPTIAYPEPSHDPPRQIGQEESSVPEHPTEPPAAAIDVHSLMMIATWRSQLPSTTRILHTVTGQGYRFIRARFFTEFWYDPQAPDVAHWLCDSFPDVIAPVSFVLLSYMDEWALKATRKK